MDAPGARSREARPLREALRAQGGRGREAFDVAEREGLVLSEGFMWRHHPQNGDDRETARRGRDRAAARHQGLVQLPARRSARARRHTVRSGARRRRLDGRRLLLRERDTGVRRRTGLGSGRSVVGESGVDIVFTATLRLPDAVLAHFDCGFVLPFRDELELVGEAGSLFVDDPWHIARPGIELRRESGTESVAVQRADSYRLELENVSDAIRSRAPLLLGREDAVAQGRVLESLHDAAERSVPA